MAPVVIGFFPVQNDLGAVAVADMHGALGGDAVECPFQDFQPPVLYLVGIDIEAGLIDLDHVGPGLGQCAGLLVQEVGIGGGKIGIGAATGLVKDAVGHGHRPRQGHLYLAVGARLGKTQRIEQDRLGPGPFVEHAGCGGFFGIALTAALLLCRIFEIDAAEMFDKAPDIMPAALFTITDNIEPGLFL